MPAPKRLPQLPPEGATTHAVEEEVDGVVNHSQHVGDAVDGVDDKEEPFVSVNPGLLLVLIDIEGDGVGESYHHEGDGDGHKGQSHLPLM